MLRSMMVWNAVLDDGWRITGALIGKQDGRIGR